MVMKVCEKACETGKAANRPLIAGIVTNAKIHSAMLHSGPLSESRRSYSAYRFSR
jgi:hypothetical protein